MRKLSKEEILKVKSKLDKLKRLSEDKNFPNEAKVAKDFYDKLSKENLEVMEITEEEAKYLDEYILDVKITKDEDGRNRECRVVVSKDGGDEAVNKALFAAIMSVQRKPKAPPKLIE